MPASRRGGRSRPAAPLFGPRFAAQYALIWDRYGRRIAPGVARLLRGRGVAAGTVLDLGCGTGALAADLTARGYQVLGVDRSPSMLRWARVAAPRARFVRGDFRTVRLPRVDAVVSTFDTLNYVQTAAELRRLFRRVRRALRPGGVFVFDLNTPTECRRGPRAETRAYLSPDATVIVRIERDPEAGRIRHRVSTLPRLGAPAPPREEVHEQRVFPPDDVQAWLRAAGLEAERVPRYPGTRADPGRAVFVARAPTS